MSRLAKQATWLSIGRIFAAILQAALIVVVARATMPRDFGIVMVFVAFVTVPQVVFDAGISTYAIRERALNRASPGLAFSLRVGGVLAVIMCFILLAILLVLGMAVDELYFFMLPLAVWAALERNADLWLGLLIADGDVSKNVVILLLRRGSALSLTIFGISVGYSSVLVYSASLAVSGLIGATLARIALNRTIGQVRSIGLGALFRQTRHYWANSVSAQSRNLDGLLVASISGPIHGGFYSMSTRLINPLRIIPDALAGILLPASTGKEYKPRDNRRPLLLIGVILALFLGVAALLIPSLTPVLLGEEYISAVPCMQIIVAGLLFSSVSSITGAILMGQGHVRTVARVAAVSSATCLLGVALGGYVGASVGAALGSAASFALQTALLLVAGNKYKSI